MSRLDPNTWSTAKTYPDAAGHVHGSRTSLAGARKIEQRRESLEDFVLSVITGAGTNGVTDAEINAIARKEGKHSEMRPRRAELLTKGYIRDSGMERENPASGMMMAVWVLA